MDTEWHLPRVISKLLLALALALSANAFAEDGSIRPLPASLVWQKGEKAEPPWVTMAFMHPDEGTSPAKKGHVLVSMEPGCLLPGATVEALPGNRFRIEFPEDEGMARDARQLLGLKGRVCIIRYKYGEEPGQGAQIVEVTEVKEEKPAK